MPSSLLPSAFAPLSLYLCVIVSLLFSLCVGALQRSYFNWLTNSVCHFLLCSLKSPMTQHEIGSTILKQKKKDVQYNFCLFCSLSQCGVHWAVLQKSCSLYAHSPACTCKCVSAQHVLQFMSLNQVNRIDDAMFVSTACSFLRREIKCTLHISIYANLRMHLCISKCVYECVMSLSHWHRQ